MLCTGHGRGVAISADRQADLACQCLHVYDGGEGGMKGLALRHRTTRRRLPSAARRDLQTGGRTMRAEARPAGMDFHMRCMRFARRAAVGQQCARPRGAHGTWRAAQGIARGAHGTARGAIFGARGQNLDCIDVGRTLIA